MIDPNKKYSMPEVMELGREGYFVFRSRTKIKELIETNKLPSHYIGSRKHKRYWLLGQELLDFMETEHRE